MLCLQCGILQNEIKAKIITEKQQKSAQKFGWNKIKHYLCTIKNKAKQQNKQKRTLRLLQLHLQHSAKSRKRWL